MCSDLYVFCECSLFRSPFVLFLPSFRALFALLPSSCRVLSALFACFLLRLKCYFRGPFLLLSTVFSCYFFAMFAFFFAVLCSFRAQYTFSTNSYTVCVQCSCSFRVLFEMVKIQIGNTLASRVATVTGACHVLFSFSVRMVKIQIGNTLASRVATVTGACSLFGF